METTSSTNDLFTSQQMDKTSAVRVGVRVRPFTAKELSASQSTESVLKCIRQGTQEIRLGSRRFTYDAVFDESVSQEGLYQSVTGPLMENFLEGFNATIMAYGQTGSGKTYTMGSEAHDDTEISPQTGIIPRFTKDLFAALQSRQEASGSPEYNGPVLTDFKLTASFLEVYGEDVHDLLIPSRPSVPIREDANGGIVCTGLTEFHIKTAEDALQVLHEGTMHRTTAATLMNLTSSRSHAVFSVTLTQTMAVPTSGEMTNTTTTSRLTFVDLAGSERMKKTGAEGERAREGIKINEGLLALGNVINALADQKKIEEGKKVHVPYRQSKLTRLLQDALGGNSQTLFLACVSPSDTNASETLSTLHYANRARNIRNAPIQNVDSSMLELRRLRSWSQVLQSELLRLKFGSPNDMEPVGKVESELLVRGEVQKYLEKLQNIALKETGNTICPLTLTMGTAEQKGTAANLMAITRKPFSSTPIRGGDVTAMDVDTAMNQSVLENFDPSLLTEVNPDHEMAILNQLLELQHREQAFDDEQKLDTAALDKMEGDLAEQESMLLQLRDSLKVYHNIKTKYVMLVAEVQQLETEKAQLASELEKATADPTQGCSSDIQRKLDKVEKSLVRARNETQKHRDQYRKLEREQQKCQVLERKIADMKNGRAAMIKKQKDAAARHREFTETKTREIVVLKRKERNAEKKVSKLQTEVQIHKRNLEKRQQFIQKLNDKLKQTETHLMKLLSTRQRNLKDRMSAIHNRSSIASRSSILPIDPEGFVSASSVEVKSARFLVERFVSEKVSQFRLNNQYQGRVEEYATAMKDMVAAVDELRKIKSEKELDPQIISEAMQAVEDAELRAELIASDLESLRSQLDEKQKVSGIESNMSRMVESQPLNVLRTLLIGMLDKLVSSEQRRNECEFTLDKKTKTLETLEHEIDLLNRKIAAFSSESAKRQNSTRTSEDPLSLVASLIDEKKGLQKVMGEKDDELTSSKKKLEDLNASLLMALAAEKEAQQKLVAIEAAGKKEAHADRALGVLAQVQHVWREIGFSSEADEDVVRSIQNCLEDTCERKLAEATAKRESLVKAIDDVMQQVESMTASLGEEFDVPTSFPSLLAKRQCIENIKLIVLPKFQAAVSQADQIAKAASDIRVALGIDNSDLPSNLQSICEEASKTSDIRNLSPQFLSICEEELSNIRLKKSEILVENNTRQSEIKGWLHEMRISGTDASNFIMQMVEKDNRGLPEWWSSQAGRHVCETLMAEPSIPKATREYSDHLETIHEILHSVSGTLRFLSESLQSVIEKAQQTLLSTVQGSHDLKEDCAGFREALLRLPNLSKERIETCLDQIAELIPGVDDMIQSEIEALTVVWEALGTPSSDRGKFWESIDQNLASSQVLEFDHVLSQHRGGVDWLDSAARKGQHVYMSLDKKLFKLQAVHKEVETLSAQQGAKSKVLSLDSEVRILNAQLADFEDRKCNKDRLLSRQAASSHLLREERYRKQMKAKLTSKLEQLADLLKIWNDKNSTDFDPSILSEDVRMLLQNTSWIEQRKELMHLRTTKSKRIGKRRIERTGSSDSESVSPPEKKATASQSRNTGPSTTTPKRKRHKVETSAKLTKAASPRPTADFKTGPSKRKAAITTGASKNQVKKRKTVVDSSSTSRMPPPASKKEATGATNIPQNILSPRKQNISREAADKENNRNKRMTLPPFGHVLAEAATPRSRSVAHEKTFGEI